jgi:ferrochelatase
MTKKTIGLLLMSYGTPANLDEVEAYYTHIRRGRKPSPEALDDLVQRYKAIGGVSPLNEITERTAVRLEQFMNRQSKDVRYKAYSGMKHVSPFVGDMVKKMADDGIEQAVGLVLAPHYSSMSVGAYIKLAEEAALHHKNLKISCIKNWHIHPAFLDAVTTRVEAALQSFSEQEKICVIFSAHSLPERILENKDPYPDQLKETGKAIADRLGLNDWVIAWQSAGRTPEPWIGPDILDVIRNLNKEGCDAVLSCPLGFVSDHLEVLYDIDIECRNVARELGVHLVRSANLNADPDFISTLAAVIDDHMAGESNE